LHDPEFKNCLTDRNYSNLLNISINEHLQSRIYWLTYINEYFKQKVIVNELYSVHRIVL